ncbi:hypothetical protein [Pseudomonas chlororaphis]
MDLSIERFWKEKFAGIAPKAAMRAYPGWSDSCVSDASYVPARLSLREGYEDLEQKVWLVAAPGAVGKSTFANEICAQTGAVYLDLASAATVAGNYVTGGLVHTNLLSSWSDGKAALVIDALDEARLRVTQPAFQDFLSDVISISKTGKYPVILLGRVGIIEETWTIINELDSIEPPILNIELFEGEESVQFVHARLIKLSILKNKASNLLEYPHLEKSLQTHAQVYNNAVHKIVNGLREISKPDANKFIGYAPVLDAIAKVIAAEKNPSRINDELQRVLEGEVLVRLGDEILRRETGKLTDQLKTAYPDLPEGIYSPAEQLERIACRLFKLPPPPMPTQLTPSQHSSYAEAVQNLLPQHPFLDGTGNSPSSAVFAASIISAALKGSRNDLRQHSEQYASFSHHAPNPFLYDFYRSGNDQETHVRTEHVGLIFESVLAKSRLGDNVSLNIDDLGNGTLGVEIVCLRADEQLSNIEFLASSSGIFRLGRRVSNVNIDAADLIIEIGTGDLLELISPVAINAQLLQFNCRQISVKSDSSDSGTESVILEAGEIIIDPSMSAPVVRSGVQFQVTWPSSMSFPWTQFSAPEPDNEDPGTVDALRTFRRLIMAFRSHSKGRLARFKDKIEHTRMLKGKAGRALLEKLISDKVLSLEDSMYYLDANILGSKAGASFLDVNLKNYSPETIQYVQNV